MHVRILGRTQVEYPLTWLSLLPGGDHQAVAAEAISAKCPVDISCQPALWGGMGIPSDTLISVQGGGHVNRCPTKHSASALIESELISNFSAIGRARIEFFILVVEQELKTFQLDGAIEALMKAQDDGCVRFVGLSASSNVSAALSAWALRDAFDFVLVQNNPLFAREFGEVSDVARQHRAGVVSCGLLNWGRGASVSLLSSRDDCASSLLGRAQGHRIIGVRTVEEVLCAVNAVDCQADLDYFAQLEVHYSDESSWIPFESDARAWVRKAAIPRSRLVTARS